MEENKCEKCEIYLKYKKMDEGIIGDVNCDDCVYFKRRMNDSGLVLTNSLRYRYIKSTFWNE